MSNQRIGMVMNLLLDNDAFRERFAENRMEAIAVLHAIGLGLTRREIELFAQSDARMWSLVEQRAFGQVH